MGFLDRWRRAADCLFPVGPGLDALTADMTKQGIVIITRNGAAYTVYWTRMPDERPARQTSVLEALGGGRRRNGPGSAARLPGAGAEAARGYANDALAFFFQDSLSAGLR